MKASYKVTLLFSVAVFVVTLGYYGTQGDTAGAPAVAGPTPGAGLEQAPAEPTPTQPRSAPTPAAEPDLAVTETPPSLTQAPPPLAQPTARAAAPTLTLAGKPIDRDALLQPEPQPEPTPQPEPEPKPEPEPDPKPAPEPRESETYTVRQGDTLSSIAITLFGGERYWVDIAQANPLVDPTRLKAGQVLRVPTITAESEREDRSDQPAPGQTFSHTVRSGETLSDIARQYYGKPTLWRVIYNANRQAIGANPNRLRAGTELTVPPSPQSAR